MAMLIDEIYEKIYEEIISCRLAPGQKLNIAQLSKHYNVGLSPIREALSRLLCTELVTAVSQRGFCVTPVSQADLEDLYDTRTQVELCALKLAIEKGDTEWEGEIISKYYQLEKFELEHDIKSSNDYQQWEKKHRAFNLSLISACHLNYLLEIQSKLYQLTERYRRQWLLARLNEPQKIWSVKKQKRIMQAVLSRNETLACNLLEEHFAQAKKLIGVYFVKINLANPRGY